MFPIDFVRYSALHSPDAIAAMDGQGRCSYRVLVERSGALGFALQSTVGKKRPVVGILGPNGIEMLVGILAIHATGGIMVPLNGRNVKAEIDDQISYAKLDALIVHHDYRDKFSKSDLPLMIAGGAEDDPRSFLSLERAHAGRWPQWEAGLGDINGIKFTGGSTGRPKGVKQSFRCINTMISSIIMAFDLGPGDRYLCAAPMTHGAGAVVLPILSRGGCVVLTADTSPAHLLEIIAREKITTTWLPPTLLYKLIDEQKANPRDVSSLVHLIWGGAAASVARLEEAREVFGNVVEVSYGQTEAPLILTFGRASDMHGLRTSSVGRVAPLADVAILDNAGNRLGPGELGEICARGDLLMEGYLDMPDETAKVLVDGWLHTGDAGLFDEQGFLYIKDRLRDVVISGGFNVYPSDVEAAISNHPAVSEVVVFGVPDDHWGERLEAAVELREGFNVSTQEILDYSKERLGSVKTPKRVHIVSCLPRSPVGKVQRREAREAAISRTNGAHD